MPEATVNPIVQSTQMPDRAGKNKTIYDVSSFEIFWRNMVAGMGRAAGNILLYFIFIFILGYMFSLLVWPTLKPVVDGYTKLINSVESLQNVGKSNPLNTGNVEKLLESYGIGN
ncbi:MAG: hypothetical protein ABFQ62_02975 [Patescibacteria group bacterium]